MDATTTEEYKILSRDLLSLITQCAVQEQHFLDFMTYLSSKLSNTTESWGKVIAIIADSLKFSDTTHFYNLCKK